MVFSFDLIRIHENPPWLTGDDGNNNATAKPKPAPKVKPAAKPAATPPDAQADQAASAGTEEPPSSSAKSRDELIAAIKNAAA